MIGILIASQVFAAAVLDQTADSAAQVSRAKQWATDTATIAGGATYCKFDEETIENYIAVAQSKIAAVATDDVDLVIARIEFTNVHSVASSREPLGGCGNFGKIFAHEAAKLN